MDDRRPYRTGARRAVVAAAMVAVCGWPGDALATAPEATAYAIVDLGTLGGTSSRANAVNTNGQVVGSSATVAGQSHAFLWQDGVMTDLGTLGGATSVANGINDKGQVVGSSITAAGQTHAFLWQEGVMTDLGTLGGASSTATAINYNGIVVGGSLTSVAGQEHAFQWANGTMTDINASYPTNYGYATAINNIGGIVGETGSVDGDTFGFFWRRNSMAWLRPPAEGDDATARDTESSTEVVGQGFYPPTNTYQPMWWLYNSSKWKASLLESPTGRGMATGITRVKASDPRTVTVIVGYGATAAGQDHALLWRNQPDIGMKFTDLGTLSGNGSSQALDISSSGIVAGYSGVSAGGPTHAVIWRP
jgi:probable HAF family extracellular repeat protein